MKDEANHRAIISESMDNSRDAKAIQKKENEQAVQQFFNQIGKYEKIASNILDTNERLDDDLLHLQT